MVQAQQEQRKRRRAPFPTEAELHVWADALDDVSAKLQPRFERAEPRRRAQAYLTGLLSNAERKNGWQLAELAVETTPDGMQRLVSTAHWEADAVRDDLVAYVLAQLADAQAVLVLDETGFVKKGTKSVGVAPQYCGTVGKIANCQIGVFLAYATRHGPVLLDRALYLPREWAEDPARCAEAGMPTQATRCLPKPTLGKQLLERAFAAGVTATWVTADSIYGGAYTLRHYLEEREQPYVLAVPSTQRVGLTAKAEQVVAAWPAEAGQRLSAGAGSQGPRWYDWAWMPMSWRLHPEGMAHWVLARRSVSKPDELAYYFVFGPASGTLEQVVQVAGTRWQVEQAFELAKQEVGLDEYEVRHWTGWYRHITLAMLALAYLTVVRRHARAASNGGTSHRKKAST
ncbi:MAG TPA: IS701 family transposase [Ktedonobacterales bacterium]|nr:IS701 family transposase [Ktedonobacterales bacterium]